MPASHGLTRLEAYIYSFSYTKPAERQVRALTARNPRNRGVCILLDFGDFFIQLGLFFFFLPILFPVQHGIGRSTTVARSQLPAEWAEDQQERGQWRLLFRARFRGGRGGCFWRTSPATAAPAAPAAPPATLPAPAPAPPGQGSTLYYSSSPQPRASCWPCDPRRVPPRRPRPQYVFSASVPCSSPPSGSALHALRALHTPALAVWLAVLGFLQRLSAVFQRPCCSEYRLVPSKTLQPPPSPSLL